MPRFTLPLALLAVVAAAAGAQDDTPRPVRFMRHPSLSPDSTRIAFSYQGDLWTVPVEGGTAQRLTIHEAHDQLPQWSPDGKRIAFSSNRDGNYDVWVIPSGGGKPKQLTFHSADDSVSGWSPDGSRILFTSSRETTRYASIYSVRVDTGATRLIAADEIGLANACATPDGTRVLCTRGGSWTRKGYRGSGNSNLISFPLEGGVGRWVSREAENERMPLCAADGKTLYFVSDKTGAFNLWKKSDGKTAQLTRFTEGNVFYPALSRSGDRIVFEHDFGLWTVPTRGGDPAEIKVYAPTDDRSNNLRRENFTSGAQEAVLSPDGKQLAFIVHGELFIQPSTGGTAVRLTNTPQREEDVAWSPDGKTLTFTSDRNGKTEVFTVDVKTKETKELLPASTGVENSAVYSPDGQYIAFARGANGAELCLRPAAGGEVRVLVRDPAVTSMTWSPDSRWIAYARMKSHSAGTLADVFVVDVTSGQATNVTRYPVVNVAPSWSLDGRWLYFLSNRSGNANVWRIALRDPQTTPDETEEAEGAAARPAAGKPVEVKIDLEEIQDRARAVTTSESGVGSYALAPDGRSLVVTMTQLGRPDLWRVPAAGGALARLTQNGEAATGLQIAPDGSRLIYRSGGGLRALPLAASPTPPVPAPIPFSAAMEIDIRAELPQMFDEAWRKMRENFYDANMHGVDWGRVRETYRPVLADITDKQDFYTLFALVLGELNSSHIGLTPPTRSTGLATASIGVALDDAFQGSGVRVLSVMPKSPADREGSRLKPGEYLLKVDGEAVTTNERFFQLLADKAGKRVELLVNERPNELGARTVKLRAITGAAYKNLEYDRWVKEREQQTERLSAGKIGYLHLSAMNDANLEKFRRAVFGEMQGKSGLVIDIRFNGGGSIADEMLAILQDKIWSYRTMRGDPTRLTAPLQVFTRPTSVMINESSFSNAEAFPWGYKALKLGKVVGVPTFGGCIGTGGTTLIDGSTLRLPSIGSYTLDGINMENHGCPPDLYVENTPDDVLAHHDRQLESAVRELMGRIER